MVKVLVLLTLGVCTASAQAPRVGEINFYGLRKISSERVLSTLGIRSGGPLPPSKGDMEEKLTELPGVIDARVEAVCCQGQGTALFIGIEERGDPHFEVRAAPVGSALLPEELLEQYRTYLAATARARTGEMRRVQDALELADPALLRDVVRNSAEPEHRAAAAGILAFGKDKVAIGNDLQYALQDADESVRATAARSLKTLALAGTRVQPVWFVEMLNSIALADKVLAAQNLVILTDKPNPATLDLIRERALSSLVDMARWTTLEYALPAFLLLGRASGIAEADLQAQWKRGDRETVIRRASRR